MDLKEIKFLYTNKLSEDIINKYFDPFLFPNVNDYIKQNFPKFVDEMNKLFDINFTDVPAVKNDIKQHWNASKSQPKETFEEHHSLADIKQIIITSLKSEIIRDLIRGFLKTANEDVSVIKAGFIHINRNYDNNKGAHGMYSITEDTVDKDPLSFSDAYNSDNIISTYWVNSIKLLKKEIDDFIDFNEGNIKILEFNDHVNYIVKKINKKIHDHFTDVSSFIMYWKCLGIDIIDILGKFKDIRI